MSYYYNPITGDIVKVTPAEKRAYDEHFREGRVTGIIEQFFGNETTFPALVALLTTFAGGAAFAWVLNLLFGYVEENAGGWSDATKEEISNLVTNTKYGGKLLVDVIVKPLTGKGDEPVPLPPGVSAPVSISYDDLWGYAVKKYGPGVTKAVKVVI
jgi:hypothetical protein